MPLLIRCLPRYFVLGSLLCRFSLAFIQVDPKTQFFIDESGRVRLFHGVNAVYKVPPWYPDVEGFDPLSSLSNLDAANLSAWGFNFVRLGVVWPGVEPAAGQYDANYLAVMKGIVDTLGAHGIYSLVDLHQDIFNRKFCGEGVPDWATPTDSVLPFPLPIHGPLPTNASNGYPDLDACLQRSFADYYFSDAVCHAFQNLYDNVDGLQDRLGGFWNVVSGYFNTSQNVIGYELINEPWPGDVYKYPDLLLQSGKADRSHLQPMYERLHKIIRNNDDEHIIFYEKALSDIVFPSGFSSGPGGPAYNDRQAMSYHVYCGSDAAGNINNVYNCDDIDEFSYNLAFNDHVRLGGGGFMTEFGAVSNLSNAMQAVEYLCDTADSHLQSWAYWQFKFFADLTTSGQGEGFYTNGSLEMSKVKTLSRTYARAIAGVPTSMTFAPSTSAFTLVFNSNSSIAAPTEIYLNEALYYPNGFTVSVAPWGAATYSQPSPNIVQVKTRPSLAIGSPITVEINAN
eukprot:TRINITY_DN7331_c0_g1_i1.p1 TRINITY_DN7331_c0_g1~~TRINITY_DN7331_c0_g1_i1.p1  ORF type:complete len:510 (+),score=172.13 TRINITY_DN7331_c0_g1_i1:1018-2547(+)